MRRALPAIALCGALLSLGAGGASAANMNQRVMLHPPMHSSMMAMVKHTTGTAAIKYTKHDANISISTQKLPDLMTMHAHAYVVWLVDGMHKVRLGSFMAHSGMGALHAMTMDTMFRQIVITAEKSAMTKHPMGAQVLVGTVMHH